MTHPRKRGTRRIVGYVVSLTGRRGGPLLQRRREGTGVFRTEKMSWALHICEQAKASHPTARVLPVVRYELDREEEALRDAVVEAAMATLDAWLTLQGVSSRCTELYATGSDTDADRDAYQVAGRAYSTAFNNARATTRALRAHLEKKP
jgi:hypothetical protein